MLQRRSQGMPGPGQCTAGQLRLGLRQTDRPTPLALPRPERLRQKRRVQQTKSFSFCSPDLNAKLPPQMRALHRIRCPIKYLLDLRAIRANPRSKRTKLPQIASGNAGFFGRQGRSGCLRQRGQRLDQTGVHEVWRLFVGQMSQRAQGVRAGPRHHAGRFNRHDGRHGRVPVAGEQAHL